MLLRCADLKDTLSELHTCREVNGETRITTHCLYPSFDPVVVAISKFGDGFHVYDDGGACRSAWLHGRDDPIISRIVRQEAARHQLKFNKGVIHGNARNIDWLPSVVLAVANASSCAATALLDQKSQISESDLRADISKYLRISLPSLNVKRHFPVKGKSGKEYAFDFGVFGLNQTILLINAVTPHPNSIASKYLAFSDAIETIDVEAIQAAPTRRYQSFAVYDRELDRDDATLMRQVADLVPLSALGQGAQRVFLAN